MYNKPNGKQSQFPIRGLMKLKTALLESVLLLRINYFSQKVHIPLKQPFFEEPTDLNRRDIYLTGKVLISKYRAPKASYISFPFYHLVSLLPISKKKHSGTFPFSLPVGLHFIFCFFFPQFLSTDFISLFYEGAEVFLILTKIKFHSTVPSRSRQKMLSLFLFTGRCLKI